MKIIFLTAAILLVAASAGAGPCDISCSQVPGMIVMSPDGALAYTITIACCGTGPVEGAQVEIEFGTYVTEDVITWAPEADPPLFTGFTNVDGEVTFHIAASGCADYARFYPGTYIAQIRVDGIVVAEPGATSPDVVNIHGELPTDRGYKTCVDGYTSASLADAVFHTSPIKLGLVEPCSKFTGNPEDPVGLEDAVIITPYIKQGIGTTCISQ
jgi:hypothetical protein